MDGKRINFNVPVEVHKGYKTWCAENGKTMREELVEHANKRYKEYVLKKKGKK